MTDSGTSPSSPSDPRRPLAVFLTLALFAVAAGTTWFGVSMAKRMERIEAERVLAEQRRETAETEAETARRELAAARENTETLRADLTREHRERIAEAVTKLLEDRPPTAGGRSAVATPLANLLESALAAETALPPPLPSGHIEDRWKLARLLMELGRDAEALPHLEQISRDLAAAEAAEAAGIMEFTDTPPAGEETDARKLLAARAAAQRGRILAGEHRAMEAAPLLKEASTLYEEWLTERMDDREVTREYARNSLLEGRVLAERKQPEEANSAFLRVAALLGSPEDEGFVPEDLLPLAEAALESAELDVAAGRAAAASEQHMRAIRLLVEFDRLHPDSIPCRTLMVRGYTGLGRLLSGSGAVRDAGIAFLEAVKLLTTLGKEQPHEPSWRLLLAQTYDEVARLARASKPGPEGVKEALEYQTDGVRFLRNLNETDPRDPRWSRPLAEALMFNGELREAAGNPAAALEAYREALQIVAKLFEEEASPLSDADRRSCRLLAGRAHAASAGLHEKAGRKKEAAESLRQALREWELAFPGGAGADEETLKAVNAARERLKRLN